MEETLERALEHARRADDPRRRVGRLDPARLRDPDRPAADRPRPPPAGRADRGRRTGQRGQGIPARLVEPPGRDGRRRSTTHAHVAGEGKEILDALGRGVGAAAITTWSSAIELLAGDAGAAERELRPALEQLQEIGERGNLASIAAQLAEALHAQGRSEEALAATLTSEEASSPDDVHAQISWRVARAKALAQLGRGREAQEIGTRRRRARRHDRLAGVRRRGAARARGGARGRGRGGGGTGRRGARAAALRGEGERRRSAPGAGAQRGTGGTYSVDARVTVSAPSSSSRRSRIERRDARIGRRFVHHRPVAGRVAREQELHELR